MISKNFSNIKTKKMEEDKDKDRSLTVLSVSMANVIHKMPTSNNYNISMADLSNFYCHHHLNHIRLEQQRFHKSAGTYRIFIRYFSEG